MQADAVSLVIPSWLVLYIAVAAVACLGLGWFWEFLGVPVAKWGSGAAAAVILAVSALRLIVLASIPLENRDFETWHLWPLFTVIKSTLAGATLLLASAIFGLGQLSWRGWVKILRGFR